MHNDLVRNGSNSQVKDQLRSDFEKCRRKINNMSLKLGKNRVKSNDAQCHSSSAVWPAHETVLIVSLS